MSDARECGRCTLPGTGYKPRCRLHAIIDRVEEIESLSKAVLKDLQSEIEHQEEEIAGL